MKVLFIGLGGIGQRHLRNLHTIFGEDLEVYAYRVRNRNIVLDDKLNIIENENLNEKYNIHIIESLEKTFINNIDFVFICNPSSMHIKTLFKIIKYNCKVFIEKPISNNMKYINKIIKIIKKKNINIYTGYQYRFHPCIINAKKILNSKVLGNIISVNIEIGENIQNWHKYENYRDMYAAKKSLGGGVILTQIHELDYINYLFGIPNSIYAVGGTLSGLNIDVEDSVSVLMKYQILDNMFPLSLHQDYLQSPPARKCKIVGDNGQLEFDLLNSSFALYINEKLIEETKFNIERNDMFMSELNYFLDSKSESNIFDSINALKIAMDIKKSIKKEKVIILKRN